MGCRMSRAMGITESHEAGHAGLNADRIPMMELLVSHGADVNAL